MIVDQEEYEAAVSCMVEAAESARVNRDELLGRLGRAFGRREPRLQAGKYVDGLMSDTPHKNGCSLAERAGDHCRNLVMPVPAYTETRRAPLATAGCCPAPACSWVRTPSSWASCKGFAPHVMP